MFYCFRVFLVDIIRSVEYNVNAKIKCFETFERGIILQNDSRKGFYHGFIINFRNFNEQ